MDTSTQSKGLEAHAQADEVGNRTSTTDSRSTVASSLQLIDENKNFNDDLMRYIQKYSDSDDEKGLNYHIVSVFGSQSTGKSTLLNRLFGTQFDVMDEKNRKQTTKGIWFSHANYIASDEADDRKRPNDKHIYVLDVEGVDGREKADDKDFERKSALFALASTEILIVNIWEHQVGLYQGANMELLKTVMEVNLALFHANRQKCLLLFVVRDFTGVTPLSNLAESLKADLGRIWQELNKPEGCEDEELGSYFDLDFFAVAHKHFQAETFEKNIRQLGDAFYSKDRLFQAEYHRGIPIDAWAIYAKQIWEQIELNKDLDLPTQQILVARFRCDEISAQAYEDFTEKFGSVDFETLETDSDIAGELLKLRNKALDDYDSQASRYQPAVYEERRHKLEKKLDLKLGEVQGSRLDQLSRTLLAEFDGKVSKLKKQHRTTFGDALSSSKDKSLAEFQKRASVYKLSENLTIDKSLAEFEASIDQRGEELKLRERDILVNRVTKKFTKKLKEKVIDILSDPEEDSWDEVLIAFNELRKSQLKRFKVGDDLCDVKLGLSAKANAEVIDKLQQQFWTGFRDVIHDFVTEDMVSRILRNKFEDNFKYDAQGKPVFWSTVSEIDTQFERSRAEVLSLITVLATAKLASDGKEIVPDVDIDHGDDLDYMSDFSDDESGNHSFGHLLDTPQQNNVIHRLKKETDAIYIDAKRSVIANKTHVPLWMYVLLIVLGWSEISAILRNPMLVTLIVVSATVLYLAYHTQMLGPMISVARASMIQVKVVAKEKLRNALLDEKDLHQQVEMDDLNEKGEKI